MNLERTDNVLVPLWGVDYLIRRAAWNSPADRHNRSREKKGFIRELEERSKRLPRDSSPWACEMGIGWLFFYPIAGIPGGLLALAPRRPRSVTLNFRLSRAKCLYAGRLGEPGRSWCFS